MNPDRISHVERFDDELTSQIAVRETELVRLRSAVLHIDSLERQLATLKRAQTILRDYWGEETGV